MTNFLTPPRQVFKFNACAGLFCGRFSHGLWFLPKIFFAPLFFRELAGSSDREKDPSGDGPLPCDMPWFPPPSTSFYRDFFEFFFLNPFDCCAWSSFSYVFDRHPDGCLLPRSRPVVGNFFCFFPSIARPRFWFRNLHDLNYPPFFPPLVPGFFATFLPYLLFSFCFFFSLFSLLGGIFFSFSPIFFFYWLVCRFFFP